MSIPDAPAGAGRPDRRPGWVTAGVVFALTPWVTIGFGTPFAFLIAAVIFSRSRRAHARVLWISAAIYAAALITAGATVGSGAHPGAVFDASELITIVGGGLQALFTLRVAAIHPPRPAQDRRSGRDRPRPARPGAEARWRFAGVLTLVLFAWVLPLTIAVTMIGLGATEMDQSIRAADGQGIPGVVVPTDENCGGDPPCSWTGNFTSSGGHLRLKNIDISGGAQKVGKPFHGLYEGSAFFENQVYPYGSHQWIWDIWFLLFGAMMLSLAAGVTIAWRRTRRRPAIPPGGSML